MARRWLLTILAGTALSFGVAGTASAQELLTEPVTVETDLVTATLTADAAEQTLAATVETDLAAEELDTEVAPTVTAEASPDGPALDVEGPVTVVGEEIPVTEAVAPAEQIVEGSTAPSPTQDQTAAGDAVAPAPAPAAAPAGPAPVTAPRSVEHSSTLTADRAAYRPGLRAAAAPMAVGEDDTLAPEIAPPADSLPLVAAAAPTVATDLALPFIDTTPTVPGLLRLLAGLLVLGAAATWRTVRDELA